MDYKRNKWLFVLSMLFLFYTANGTSKKHTSTTDIMLHVVDKDLLKEKLTVTVIKDYIFGEIGSSKYTIACNSRGDYKLSLSKITHPIRIIVGFSSEKYNCTLIYHSIIEPNDNLRIDYLGSGKSRLKKEDFIFSGIGSNKLKAQNSINFSIPDNRIKNIKKGDLLDSLTDLRASCDSNYNYYKRILFSYRRRIHPDIFEMIDADIYGKSYISFLSNLTPNSNKNDKIAPITSFYRNFGTEKYTGSVKWILQSERYLQYLYFKARLTARLKDSLPTNKFKNIYKEIIRQNTGALREKLLIYFFSMGLTAGCDNPNLVYTEALNANYIQKPVYRLLLNAISNKTESGHRAYEFNLPDQNGKLVKLSNFKGKVLVLDFWFTGCINCHILANEISKNVLPNFKKESNVVFISINVDKDRNQWLKSIKSGLYTHPTSLNLFTNGLGLEHPLIKYYNYQGFPQLLLIDKYGNLVSANMRGSGEYMNTIIQKALNQDTKQ